jgi:hypothetical protein
MVQAEAVDAQLEPFSCCAVESLPHPGMVRLPLGHALEIPEAWPRKSQYVYDVKGFEPFTTRLKRPILRCCLPFAIDGSRFALTPHYYKLGTAKTSNID